MLGDLLYRGNGRDQAPSGLGLTAPLTAISGQGWAWPWALGPLFALNGGAAGLFPRVSLVAVLPLDENSGPAQAWPVKVWVTLILILVLACTLATIALLVVGAAAGLPLLQWPTIPLGLLTGAALAIGLGRAAETRLASHQHGIPASLKSAAGPA